MLSWNENVYPATRNSYQAVRTPCAVLGAD